MNVLLKIRWALTLMLVMLVSLLGLIGEGMGVAHAATTFTITNCTNDTQLQADITTANADNADDTIIFACSGDISLTSTLNITGSMNLDGNGQSVTLRP